MKAPIGPADLSPCPMCGLLMQDFFCVPCQAVTVLPPWFGLAPFDAEEAGGAGKAPS